MRPEQSTPRLLRSARAGSPEAVEALIERYWDRSHRIAYGILGDAHAAEDVTQEAMLSVVRGLGRFDVYRPFEPWLHRVVTNRALDWARSRSRRAEVAVGAFEAGGSGRGALYPHGGTKAPHAAEGPDPRLEQALAALEPEQRAVVVLRHIGGYGPEEIGVALGIPRGTVGSRLRRALDQLRTEMEE